MARNDRKKTDIPVPEPRHRVGPRGVSSGISFRELPPASLDQIKKVCEHYQQKCAGTYKSLASRYVYQMATEIEGLVEILKEESASESSVSTMEEVLNQKSRTKERGSKQKSRSRNGGRPNLREDPGERRSDGHFSEQAYPSRHRSDTCREKGSGKHNYFNDGTDSLPNQRFKNSCCFANASCCKGRNEQSVAQQNLEDQNEEILRWLKEEMDRSHALLMRSKRIHDSELDNAQEELEKVKKAAKLIIKAVYKKGKDKVEKSQANAERERRRRVKSQRMIDNLIRSHSHQIELLRTGLHSAAQINDVRSARCTRSFHPCSGMNNGRNSWMSEDPRELCGLMDDSDLTSVLDELAEESYQQSCCSVDEYHN